VAASVAGRQVTAGFSLIVSVYNRSALLARCLASVASQSVLPSEIIVCDDGSDEDLLPCLEAAAARLPGRLVQVRQGHQGFRLARSRNNGIKVATEDRLLFIDQDIVGTRRFLETAVTAIEARRFVVGYPVRLTAEQTLRVTEAQVRSGDYRAVYTRRETAPVRRQYYKDRFYGWLHRLSLGTRPRPKVCGAVHGMWKADLVRIDGYDENFVGWGNEDDDLGRRLHRAGVHGGNPFRTEFPLHLHHPPHRAGLERPNQDYARRRLIDIAHGAYRAPNGLSNPRDRDAVTSVIVRG
jgi:glycosyltransferase involved in cell wall biosynthesis